MLKYDNSRYKFISFKADTSELIDFFDEHDEELKILKNKCWGTFYKFQKGYYSFEIHLDWYFLMINDKIVANASVHRDNVLKSRKVDVYKLIKTDKLEEDNYVKLYPVISSLCRDINKRYRGAGRYLLEKICEVYKGLGHNHIFLIPESIIYRFRDVNDDCGITRYQRKYLNSQKKLISYYDGHGFKKHKKFYEREKCNKDNEEYYIYYPVYLKQL